MSSQRLPNIENGAATAEPLSDPFAGRSIAGYHIESFLGKGAMGSVYRGYQQSLGRRVAIKILDLGALDPGRPVDATDLWQRFQGEARSAASINHPNVVTVHDFGIMDVDGSQHPYIVMELLDGYPLDELPARGSVMIRDGERPQCAMPFEPAREVFLNLMRGVKAAHDEGIVHRDIKGGNVFLHRAAGCTVPKLLDFGISKIDEKVAPRNSNSGVTYIDRRAPTHHHSVFGTLECMPFEQFMGAGETTQQTDLYALGCVFYFMLTGQYPYEERINPNAENALAEWMRVHYERTMEFEPPAGCGPMPVTAMRHDLPDPDWVTLFLKKALAPDRKDRFRTIDEMIESFGPRILEGGHQATPPEAYTILPPPPTSTISVRLIMVVVCVLGLILASIGMRVYRDRSVSSRNASTVHSGSVPVTVPLVSVDAAVAHGAVPLVDAAVPGVAEDVAIAPTVVIASEVTDAGARRHSRRHRERPSASPLPTGLLPL